MRRYALALWFAALALLGALRGWLAWRDHSHGTPVAAHELLWWVGAVACAAVGLGAWVSARRGQAGGKPAVDTGLARRR